MASALFNTTGKFRHIAQLSKWTNAVVQTGVAKRFFDAKPMWAQLKITERCNLNCGYCTEHNNSGKHVSMDTVLRWITHCSELGVKHIEFIGGEPLMHPDLFEMIAFAKQKKINTGMTTNGFLMDKAYADRLIKAGIVRLQLSIDCVDANEITRKALNLLKPQLEYMRQMDIWVHVNSVIVKETISQAYELAELLFEKDIPVAFSPAHDRGRLLGTGSNSDIVHFLDWLIQRKTEGAPVNMPNFLINYYRDTLGGKLVPWTCVGGCKAFYVDTEGFFRICSHTPSNQKFEDVTLVTFRSNHGRKKGCEMECGVSCMIVNSFPFSRLDYVAKSDLFPFLRSETNTLIKG
jgi:MoaA/NifB/PqqE/SkfB family radical SAM enzyme